MASAHGNRADQKDFFMAGYNEMLKRIEPETIICYHYPFPEMKGNIQITEKHVNIQIHMIMKSIGLEKTVIQNQVHLLIILMENCQVLNII